MQELMLKCIATHERKIIEYTSQVLIRTYDNHDEVLSAKPNTENYANKGTQGSNRKNCLINRTLLAD